MKKYYPSDTSFFASDYRSTHVFVFGSNMQGIHAGGAARAAHLESGFPMKVYSGETKNCYALPTCVSPGRNLELVQIANHVEDFLEHCKMHPEKSYFVTKVGCGLAGFKDREIAPLFVNAKGDNLWFSEDWKPHLNKTGEQE